MRVLGSVFCIIIGTSVVSAQEFSRHVAVCQEAHAADIGREAMRSGGNAVDSAVATAFALAVTHPAAGNLGGGGFLVAYLADRREVVTIDFRETAPAASTRTMYLDARGKLLPLHRSGLRAAGVPGTVRGLGLAHKQMGKRPWPDLVAPSVRLARDGFPVSDTLARSLNAQLFRDARRSGVDEDLGARGDRLGDFPESVAAFRKPDGTLWKAGDILKQPDLALTLERIARDGADEFYLGKTADLIAEDCARRGGIITRDDLAAYRAIRREPVHGTFRGHDVYGMGPPASGGILILQMLNMLERFDLKASGPRSPNNVHLITEAMRRAFFTRATQIADPDFVDVPTAKLVSKPYADELAATIEQRATPSESLAPFRILDREGADTTHLSTLDSEGNAVALTYTLEEGYGSKDVIKGAGFLMNNEMGDFNLIPELTTRSGGIGTKPNEIEPGKRMLSSQSPTIVLKDGKVRLVTGSPGGRTIPNTTVWVILNVLEFGLSGREAVDAPRTHHAWFPDQLLLEGTTWPAEVKEALRARGHRLVDQAIQGDAHTIAVNPASGKIEGVADRRRETSRASGD